MKYQTFDEWAESSNFRQVIDTFGLDGMVTAVAMIAWEAAREGTEAEVYEKLATQKR